MLQQLKSCWRYGVALCILVASVVFFTNLGILTWTEAHHPTIEGASVVFEGDCGKSKRLSQWLHLAINILGTALLGCSNYGMQILSAPTREELDSAHARKKWVDIGVHSLRNLRYVNIKKALLWLCLGLSSIPLHLPWNSGIFDQLTANDYIAVLVTEKFLQGGNWTSYAMYDPQIHSLQNNKTLDRFDNDACIRAYSSSPFVAHRKNLLLVSDAVNDTNTVLQVRYAGIEGTGTHYEWMCESSTTGNLDKNGICYPNVVIQHAADWQPFLGELSENGVTSPGRVQYCLSERTIPTFQLGISSDILIAVLICNAVKIACFIATIWIGKTDPLVTTGGAVESFLNEPDVITRGRCNISKRDVTKRKLAWTADCATVPLRWKGQRKSWRRAASVIRWLACFIPALLLMTFALSVTGLFTPAAAFSNPKGLSALGIGQPQPGLFVLNNGQRSVVENSLLANTPQLLVSYVYLAYNGLYTAMLAAAAWTHYAVRRRGLRVTWPKRGSAQRCRVFLQLPYTYGVPLLVASALLHWLISQSLFMVRITVFGIDGVEDPNADISAVGYWPMGVVLAVSLGGLLLVVVCALGFGMRFAAHMPLAAGCSASVAAACQPKGEITQEEEDIALKPVMWGVVAGTDGADDGVVDGNVDLGDDDLGTVGHVTFSAYPVEKLVVGRLFA